MIEIPPRCSLDEAVDRLGNNVVVWATPSVRDRLPWKVSTALPDDAEWLLAAGGGTLIDRAKIARASRPGLKLAALPTIWGSGAEASPIAVQNDGSVKAIRIAADLRPDLIVSHPALAQSLPAHLVKAACGDTWAHALEGFLSPLASDELRVDLADVIRRMLALPLAFSPEWFEVSALACAGQSQAGVGLIHGAAHVLELAPGSQSSHAKLCTLLLLPVMRFNSAQSEKWSKRMQAHALPEQEIWKVLRALFDATEFAALRPALAAHWRTILRDPCTRTNSALVRPGDLAFLENFHAA